MEHGFVLHKSAFHDALALHYGWPLGQIPSDCACGTHFSADHAQFCGLSTLCHNEIRDLTATLLTEVCHQVQVEPELQPVSSPETFSLLTANIQDGARLDIVMNEFWGGHSERCYVDVRVLTPLPPLMLLLFLVLLNVMKMSSAELMGRESERLSMFPLHPLFWLQQWFGTGGYYLLQAPCMLIGYKVEG